ncbi:MAG TPA: sugar ABC transporter substrate-binding protein [Gaiellaceae bacterium]|nr:sugar ABC transporter substrate-binding protein [Gaiellaceae bacterium]
MSRISASAALLIAVATTAAVAAGGAAGAGARPAVKTVRVAYLSFAVANSYDAPMLAAAKAVAKAQGAKVTVFDAANDPKKQLAQLQTASTSKQYDAIIVQPIFGPQLIPTIKSTLAAKIKVVNMDQILGTNPGTAAPPVPGMAGNVVFVQTQIGTKQGGLAVKACAELKANPCKVGYLYSVKVSSLDTAIRKGFDAATAGHGITVVAEGETFYNPANALKAAQTMLQAQPDLNVIVGADQGATGAQQALNGKKVTLIGYGGGGVGLKAVGSGAWYGTVIQRPATEGKLAMQCAVKAVRTGKGCGGIDVLAGLPDGGVVTKANVSKFKAEWPG